MRRSGIRLAAAAGVVSISGLLATCGGDLSAQDEQSVLDHGYSGSGRVAREFVLEGR